MTPDTRIRVHNPVDRDASDYLQALRRYLFPEAADVAGRDVARLEAVLKIRAIERRHALVTGE